VGRKGEKGRDGNGWETEREIVNRERERERERVRREGREISNAVCPISQSAGSFCIYLPLDGLL
jgi:hypothetical protein